MKAGALTQNGGISQSEAGAGYGFTGTGFMGLLGPSMSSGTSSGREYEGEMRDRKHVWATDLWLICIYFKGWISG